MMAGVLVEMIRPLFGVRANSVTARSISPASRASIGLTYRGIRHGPPDVIDRLNRGEPVDPATYYFRTALAFETAALNIHVR